MLRTNPAGSKAAREQDKTDSVCAATKMNSKWREVVDRLDVLFEQYLNSKNKIGLFGNSRDKDIINYIEDYEKFLK